MRLVHASAAAPAAGARPAKARAAQESRVRTPPAARLRGLLAASESLLAVEDGDSRREHPDEAPGALGTLLACERAHAAGRPDRLLELLEDDLARALVGAAAGGPSDSPDADVEARPARPAARLAPGYCAALGLDGALPGQARARLAGLAALRGVLLAGRPCAALLPCLAAELQAPPRGAAAACGAPGAGADAGTAGYLLGVLRRLGSSEGLGLVQRRRASDMAAWLAAAAGRSDAAAPAGEWWDEGAGAAVEDVGGGVTPGTSLLGAFFAEVAAGDSALAEAGDADRHHAAPTAPAGVAAGAPAACVGSDWAGHGQSAHVPAASSGSEPVAPDEGQETAGSAAPDAQASAWAAAALRACAVRAATAAAEAAAPAGELGQAGGGAARLFRRAGAGSEGRGASDLALAEWLCCGEGGQGVAPDPAWPSRKRRRMEPAEGAAAPNPAAADGALGDAEPRSAGAPGPAVKADDPAPEPAGAAVKAEGGAPRPASPAAEPWGPAAAAARHGLPAPALLAPALARLLDARAWARVAALERAGALQAQPAAQPGPDPDARPRAAPGGAAGPAGGGARAEGAAEVAELSDAEACAASGGGAADAQGGGAAEEPSPASAGGAAADERAESLESRRLLAAAGALTAFLRGIAAGAPGDPGGPGAAQAAAEGQRAVEALFVCLGAAPLPAPPPPPPQRAAPAVALVTAPGLPADGSAAPGPAAAPDRAPDAPAGLAAPGPLDTAGGGGAPAELPPGPVKADPGAGLGTPAAGSALCELVGRLTRAEDAAAVAAAAAGALAWAGAFDSAPSRLAAAPGLAPRLQPGLAAVQARPAASAAGLAVRAGRRPARAR